MSLFNFYNQLTLRSCEIKTQEAAKMIRPSFSSFFASGLLINPISSTNVYQQNHCINGVIDRYGLCNCEPGFAGKHCNQPLCNPQCLNGGICIAPDTCECSQDFFGIACHLSTETCVNGQYFENSNFCKCHSGYIGESCNIPICETSCGENENRGTCFAPNVCKCNDGFFGKDCLGEKSYSHCSIQLEHDQDRVSTKKVSVISDNELGVFETFERELVVSDKISMILDEVDASFNGVSMKNATMGYTRVLKCLKINIIVSVFFKLNGI